MHEGGGLDRWKCESYQLKPALAALTPSLRLSRCSFPLTRDEP
jgi:hypothetical protein